MDKTYCVYFRIRIVINLYIDSLWMDYAQKFFNKILRFNFIIIAGHFDELIITESEIIIQ